jgi:hypothetical protein
MSEDRLAHHAATGAGARTGAVADAEAADWRQRLLANVSHELRTPLNAIIGFSEMLANVELSPKDPDRQREYARIINASGQHLLSVVNTILDMSKIESGVFAIEPEHFDLAGLIDFSCDLVKLKAQEKTIELLAACAPDMGEIVADKRATKQILLNLLSNAVKFTPEGGRVAISARREGGCAVLNVSDTGIGVTPTELQRLGDPFYQARATYDAQRAEGWPANAPNLSISRLRNNRVRVTVGARANAPAADVWLIAYDPGPITVVITGGANRNRSVAHYNLVKWIERLESWDGQSAWYERQRCQPDCAVLLQEVNGGRILAAAYTSRPSRY